MPTMPLLKIFLILVVPLYGVAAQRQHLGLSLGRELFSIIW